MLPSDQRSSVRELRHRGVSFDDSLAVAPPFLVGQRNESADTAAAVAAFADNALIIRHVAEPFEEDDSLEMVASADTGAGRAHTPQRLNRSGTPQRLRPSRLVHTAVAPAVTSALRGDQDARRQPRGRRKQRRWDNDNLLGVEKYLRGRHAQEEGEGEHLTVTHSWRSSLSSLVSDQNRSAEHLDVREEIRKGLQPEQSPHGKVSDPGARNFVGSKWADAEERFLLVEKRLRDIVVRCLRNSALLTFVRGLECLLEAFVKKPELGSLRLPYASTSALVSRPTVERPARNPDGFALLVPLGPSPFHRLLLHALCQYRKLTARSEETAEGRIVRVTLPYTHLATRKPLPTAFLSDFIVNTRHQRRHL